MTHKRPTETPKAIVARQKNLHKARAAHPKGHQTAVQLASERANLTRAKAHKTSITAAQRAADRANGLKASAAMRSHPSAKLLAAEAKYVAAGRAAWLRGEMKWKMHGHRNALLGHRATLVHSLKASPRAPLGAHLDRVGLTRKITPPRLYGEPRKFAKRITPTGYGRPSSWQRSRTHHFKKRIAMRKTRRTSIGNWRRTRTRVRPR